MAIGKIIKERRLELGLTLEQVAQMVGTSKQTIHRYEVGIISNIPSDKIEALAKALQTTPQHLMGWDSDQNNGQPEGYYMDAETAALAQAAYEDPELRMLMDAKKDLSPEDFNSVINIVKALKAKEGK